MEIGLFTSGYQRCGVEEMFCDAHRFGYDYIELWGGRPHAFAPDLKGGGVKELRDLSERWGVPIRIYTPELNAYPYNFMQGSEAQWADCVDYMVTALEVSAGLGCEATVLSAGHAGLGPGDREIWERLVKTVELLVRRAEGLGQRILWEPLTPWESNVITNANQLERLLEAVPSPALAGMCDVVPPFVQGEGILSYFDKLGDRLGHLHLVDSSGSDETHLVPGEGVLPLTELAAELRERDYRGTATIELVTHYLAEPRLYARRAIENLRALFGEG